jgi:hypothetical protein
MRSMRPTPTWTVAKTLIHDEWRAAYAAETLGFEYYLPETSEWRGGRRRRQRVYPGFLFIHLRRCWKHLLAARDYFRLILLPDEQGEPRPARVLDCEIRGMRSLEGVDGLVSFAPGLLPRDRVVVRAGWGGVYSGISGIVRALPAPHRVEVALRMLGRSDVIAQFDPQALQLAT